METAEDLLAGQEDLVKLLKDGIASCHEFQDRQDRVGVWFGISDMIHNFSGRATELDRLHQLVTVDHDLHTDSAAYTVLTSIYGLGGIGKTTLARKYAWTYAEFYDRNGVCINCENGESIRSSFVRLAVTLQLPVVDGDGGPIPVRALASKIYAWFGSRSPSRKVLFIFDNVEEMHGPDGVAEVLPGGLPPGMSRPYVVITSRRSDLIRNGRVLQLDVLTFDDAVALLQFEVPTASRVCLERLVRMLGRLPLALQIGRASCRERV